MTDSNADSDVDEITAEDINIPDGTPVHGSKHYEVGIDENGNGYVEIRPAGRDSHRFPVNRDEIEEFTAKQSRNAPPGPTKPEGHIPGEDISLPDGWEGGLIEHTGGNIWCRIFRKPREDGGHYEVIYDPQPPILGVSAGVYDDESAWLGEIDNKSFDGDPMETQVVEASKDLMEAISNGEYDDKIAEICED